MKAFVELTTDNFILVFILLTRVITILKETQMQTRSIIWSVNNEKIKKLAKNNLNTIQNIIKVCDEYKIHKNVIQYSKIVGYKGQGIRV